MRLTTIFRKFKDNLGKKVSAKFTSVISILGGNVS